MIRVKGDLLALAEQGKFDVIVHGCNCYCTMGSGIARQIREKYPQAYEADCATKSGDYNKLGNFSTAGTDKFVIVNAYTQYGFNKPGESEDVFEYTSFAMILQKLLVTVGDLRIGLPYIGMGLAGGDKDLIMVMLENFSLQVTARGGTVTLVEFG